MDLGLKGKVVIVTGGSEGIGGATSRLFAEEGANVVVNYFIDSNQGPDFAQELADTYGVETLAVRGDISNEDDVKRIVASALERFGTVDILVNNAAKGSIQKEFHTLTTEEWRSVQEITLNGAYFMSREVITYWREHDRGGRICNLVSKSAFTTNGFNNTSYISAKAGVAGLTRGTAHEYAAKGIYINGVVPGYVQTEHTYPDGDPRTERNRKLLATGEFAKPIDIANVIAFLCSDRARQCIGSIVDVSGGNML